ncbi:MAG: MoaD/ThiS family protein [Actinomycetota bacterium]
MARVVFTQNLQRHVACPPSDAPGATVREVLDVVFERTPRLRGYVVDETGCLRKHMTIFVDGELVSDRRRLSDPVHANSEIYVMQALSGGC